MHKLAEICVRRPVFATVIILSLGGGRILRLQTSSASTASRKSTSPTITVTTRLVGAAPEEIETDITDKIEESINTISGIDSVAVGCRRKGPRRSSLPSFWRRNLDVAAQEVRDKVNTILRDLPKDADPPIIQEDSIPDAVPDPRHRPLRPRADPRHHRVRDKRLRRRLESISGVGQVLIVVRPSASESTSSSNTAKLTSLD